MLPKKEENPKITNSPLFWNSLEGKEKDPNFEALQSLLYGTEDDNPDEVAENFKNQGNNLLNQYKDNIELVKKYFKNIIKYYSDGISFKDKIKNKKILSQLYCNRGYAHFLMKNFRNCIEDCEECLKIDQKNLKAIYRISNSFFELKKYDDCIKFAELGIGIDEKFEKDFEKIIFDSKKEKEKIEKEILEKEKIKKKNFDEKKNLMEKFKSKNIKIGINEMDSKSYNLIIPNSNSDSLSFKFDEENKKDLIFCVIFVYDQFNQTDIVQNFNENDKFIEHISELMPPFGDPIPYGDKEQSKNYNIDNIKLFFLKQNTLNKVESEYFEIDVNYTLISIFNLKDYYIPPSFIPIFHIVSKNFEKKFYENFS